MFREKLIPVYLFFGIGLAFGLGFLSARPMAHPISSIEETEQIMVDLGLQWDMPGTPVIVFTDVGCAASHDLVANLDRSGIKYLRVEAYGSEMSNQIHKRLGRSYLGTVAIQATPTTIVGTSVIRGNNIAAILREHAVGISR